MMRLLYYGESPFNPTGFGQVNRHILAGLAEVAEVTCVASSLYVDGGKTEEAAASEVARISDFPYRIIGCDPEDKGGTQRNEARIKREVEKGEWDIFFYQGDCNANNDVLEKVAEWTDKDPSKNSIFYMPIDCDTSMGGSFYWFTRCTVSVVYTEHGRSVIERCVPPLGRVTSVMGLGCEPEVFYPYDAEKRREARHKIFSPDWDERFIVVNVNRNQPRKDLARCMAAFHLFHVKHPEALLYMHSVKEDSGGDLAVQAYMGGCEIWKQPPEIAFSNLDLSRPWSREVLNDLYNACDVLVSTSLGEGWGLTTTEAMCAGLPVLVPDNTANWDIVGRNQERGWSIKTGGDLDHTIFTYGKEGGGSPHDIIHSQSFVDQLEYIYTHREEVAEKCQKARQWCQQNTWEHRKNDWKQLIRLIEQQSSLTTSTTL